MQRPPAYLLQAVGQPEAGQARAAEIVPSWAAVTRRLAGAVSGRTTPRGVALSRYLRALSGSRSSRTSRTMSGPGRGPVPGGAAGTSTRRTHRLSVSRVCHARCRAGSRCLGRQWQSSGHVVAIMSTESR